MIKIVDKFILYTFRLLDLLSRWDKQSVEKRIKATKEKIA